MESVLAFAPFGVDVVRLSAPDDDAIVAEERRAPNLDVAEGAVDAHAVQTSAAGQVDSWSAHVGQQVTSGEEIGTFIDQYGPVSITAPCSGILGKMGAQGARVVEGALLCYVEPDGPETRQEDADGMGAPRTQSSP